MQKVRRIDRTRKVEDGVIVSSRQVLCTLNAIEYKKPCLRRPPAPPERREIFRCKVLAEAAPSIRQERVSAIREALNEASYCIDDYQVAAKMVDRSLVDTICATTL